MSKNFEKKIQDMHNTCTRNFNEEKLFQNTTQKSIIKKIEKLEIQTEQIAYSKQHHIGMCLCYSSLES